MGRGVPGKSYTSKTAIDIMIRSGYNITMMCPTGISAKVLTNFTGRQAYTVHRYFLSLKGNGVSKPLDETELEEENVIENVDEMVYYCDECGMWGLTHFDMLCTKVLAPAMERRERYLLEHPNCPKEELPSLPKLVLVGDTNQLQPVSSGCFFRDILDLIRVKDLRANLTELTQIMRAKSDSYIPYICDKYCVDPTPIDNSVYANKEANVLMLPLSEELETGEAIAKFVYDYIKEMNDIDPKQPFNFENTTIMLPQRVGDKGTEALNKMFDELYHKDNPNAKTVGMVTKNDYELEVFNGDRFRIESKDIWEEYEYEDKKTGKTVKNVVYQYTITMLDDDREVKFTDGELNWELAYCSTVHKLQGCTSENVIFVASRTHTFMLTKQLVYTALSRASKTLTVLYDKFTFENARRRDTKYNRKTFLGEIVKIRKGRR